MLTISNSGGELETDYVLEWNEKVSCKVARRDVPKREEGEVIDTGTFAFPPRIVTTVVRLSNSEKTKLQNIFDENKKVIVTIGGQTYLGWLKDKSIDYEYSTDGTTVKPWKIKLTFDIWFRGIPLDYDGIKWGYFKVKGEIWFDKESGGYTEGYPIYITDPFAMQGGGYFETRITDCIPNGGFETGDHIFWIAGDDISVVTEPKEGIYSAKYDSVGGYHFMTNPWVEQVSIGSFSDSAIFSAWLKCSAPLKNVEVLIMFSTPIGDALKYINFSSPNTNWFLIDLLPFVQVGQSTNLGPIQSDWKISLIEFDFTMGYYWWLDGVVLKPWG